MAREYRHIKIYEKEIIELRKQGLIQREIAEKLGFSKEQIKEFFHRYNRNQRKLAARIKAKGRPRKDGVELPPSMSRHENPYDNALAENFFSILKTECIYQAKFHTYEEAHLLIDEYIHFYNNERIQLKTKLTPLEKRSQYIA